MAESSREVAVGLVLGVAVLSIIGLLSRVAGDTLDLVLGAAVLCIGGMLSGVVDVLDLELGLGGASPIVGFSRLDSVTRDAVGFLLGLGGLCISGVLSGLVGDGCERLMMLRNLLRDLSFLRIYLKNDLYLY